MFCSLFSFDSIELCRCLFVLFCFVRFAFVLFVSVSALAVSKFLSTVPHIPHSPEVSPAGRMFDFTCVVYLLKSKLQRAATKYCEKASVEPDAVVHFAHQMRANRTSDHSGAVPHTPPRFSSYGSRIWSFHFDSWISAPPWFPSARQLGSFFFFK